jgi:archaellum biogenesis protein FlaJ (TadC family)
MEDTRVILAGLWVALMLTYLLGDVLRIFAGDFTSGEIKGQKANRWMWLVAALVMLIPIVMIVLSLTLAHPAIRWVTIAASMFLILFNLVGLPYPGVYDNFLIVVGLAFNGLIIWHAWNWTQALAEVVSRRFGSL